MSDIAIYKDGTVVLETTVNDDTIWLNQKQLCELFERDKSVISRHIRNIYAENELDKNATVAKNATVQIEGKREVLREVEYYNLDLIISLGYRVNSKRATLFRQWATSVLKQHLLKGYTLDQKRLDVLEGKQIVTDKKLDRVLRAIDDKSLKPRQGIFYDGQIYDAYAFVNNLLKSAKQDIVLIDNYIDDTVLTLFSKYPDLQFTIITKSITKRLKLDIDKYNAQYKNLTLKTSKNFHDRFIIIDQTQAYHIGASLKDLGKKIFAFSQIDRGVLRW